jgi:hypothetical protein
MLGNIHSNRVMSVPLPQLFNVPHDIHGFAKLCGIFLHEPIFDRLLYVFHKIDKYLILTIAYIISMSRMLAETVRLAQ